MLSCKRIEITTIEKAKSYKPDDTRFPETQTEECLLNYIPIHNINITKEDVIN